MANETVAPSIHRRGQLPQLRHVNSLLPRPRNPDIPTGRGLPVRGYPNRTWARSSYPRSWHPLIVAAIPVVVALHPDIVGARADASHTHLRSWRWRSGWHRNHNRRSGSHKSSGSGSRGRHHYNFSAPTSRKRSGHSSENRKTSNLKPHRTLPPSSVEAGIAGLVSLLISVRGKNEQLQQFPMDIFIPCSRLRVQGCLTSLTKQPHRLRSRKLTGQKRRSLNISGFFALAQ
jgi:hypothetical protein